MEAEALTTQDLATEEVASTTDLTLDDFTADPADDEFAVQSAELVIDEAAMSGDAMSGDAVTSDAAFPDALEAAAAAVPFAQFGVAEPICAALEAAGITTAFPIQALTLPVALDNHDIIGQARTGTGKTLAFGIPMLQHVLDTPRAKPTAPRGLVVVPTRELAIQVAEDLRTASARSDVNVVTLYGGRAYEPQIEALATVDIVVGTPGRLLDLSRQRKVDLSSVDILVLDEADRMLDLGFLPDVEAILRLTPDSRQTMLFSATMPSEVVTLARRHLHRPMHIRAEHHDEPAHVPTTDQHVFRAHQMDKIEVLARVLQAEGRGLTIVFCRTRRSCDNVTTELTQRGFAAAAVHGDLGQSQRERALRAFRAGKIDVLVATDVAARGLDVDDVTHVVNHECPEDEKAYLHRTGRTGRAGRTGVAVTFVDWQDMPRWKLINDTLNLGHPEPTETYSTSEHLYSSLGIPAGSTGSLPRAQRERAGLEAEDLEDIGETGGHRSRQPRSGDGGGREQRSGQRSRGARTSDGPQDRSEAAVRTSKPRRRTRSGQPLAADGRTADGQAAGTREPRANNQPEAASQSTQGAAPGVTPTGQEGSGQPRKRRRSGRGRGGRPSGSPASGGPANGAPPASGHVGSVQPHSTRPASTTERRDIEAG
jgi:superfamily II DNA/RNA helicase